MALMLLLFLISVAECAGAPAFTGALAGAPWLAMIAMRAGQTESENEWKKHLDTAAADRLGHCGETNGHC